MAMRANYKYEILTPDGFKPFYGVRKFEREGVVTLETMTSKLVCSPGHRVMTNNGWMETKDLQTGDKIVTTTGYDELVSIMNEKIIETYYEPIEVQGHAYVANDIVNHNCEFLSSDALLINSIRLHQLRWEAPIFESLGFKFWVPEDQLGGRGKIYLMGVDPATGSGNDYTSIEVFEFPSLKQIAEFRTNDINIPLIYAKIKWLLKKLTEVKHGGRAEVLWTFERNGIGEALSALYQNDDDQNIDAELVSDNPMKHGCFTSGKNKIQLCLQLKTLLEKINGGMEVRSEALVHELKHFVARGGTYEAKSGATDDSVMATVQVVRLLKRLSEYNEEAFKQVNEYIDPEAPMDQSSEPMPFMIT